MGARSSPETVAHHACVDLAVHLDAAGELANLRLLLLCGQVAHRQACAHLGQEKAILDIPCTAVGLFEQRLGELQELGGLRIEQLTLAARRGHEVRRVVVIIEARPDVRLGTTIDERRCLCLVPLFRCRLVLAAAAELVLLAGAARARAVEFGAGRHEFLRKVSAAPMVPTG